MPSGGRRGPGAGADALGWVQTPPGGYSCRLAGEGSCGPVTVPADSLPRLASMGLPASDCQQQAEQMRDETG